VFLRVLRDSALFSVDLSSNDGVRGLTAADLEELSGLSRPSVAGLLRRFEPILEVQDADGNPSRRSDYGRRWAIDPSAGVVVGVEIGDELTRVAVSDLYGRIMHVENLVARQSADETIDEVAVAILRLLGDRAVADVVGVGISLAAPVDGEGGFAWPGPAGIRWSGRWDEWQLMRVRDDLRRRLRWAGTPFVLENDAYLSALAEFVWGVTRSAQFAGMDYANMVYIEWSRRIGAGLILEGDLYRGRGLAGEFGHSIVHDDENARVCERCGNLGCLETVAGWESVLRSLGPGHFLTRSDLRAALEVAAEPDTPERLAFESAATELGRALGPVITLLNPEVVIIGGDIGKWGFEVVRSQLLRSLIRHTVRPALADVSIVPPTLREDAALQGVNALVLRGTGGHSELLSYLQRYSSEGRGIR
jgi:predicted NBD/HSP70 family sugar kinase